MQNFTKEQKMKMSCKRFIGLPGIFLAFGLAFVACDNGNENGNGGNDPDNTVNAIESAFTNMLKANFIDVLGIGVGPDVTVNAVTKMSNWGQDNSEYAVKGTKGYIIYRLPSSFGTVKVMSGGAAVIISGGAVLMTGPNASIVWERATGAITSIEEYGDINIFQILSGSDAKTVTYPYTVAYPSGSNAQIKGNLKLNLSKW